MEVAIKKGRDSWQSRGNTHTRNRARLISHSFEIIVADANNSDFRLTKPILAFTIGKYITAHRKDDQVEYHNDEYHPSDSYLFSRRTLTLFSCFYFARSRFYIDTYSFLASFAASFERLFTFEFNSETRSLGCLSIVEFVDDETAIDDADPDSMNRRSHWRTFG